MGWLGNMMQLQHFLRVVGADRDEDGKFFVGGTVTRSMGGDDVVVGEDAYYFVGGKRCTLASGLRGTSYGTSVVVITPEGVE